MRGPYAEGSKALHFFLAISSCYLILIFLSPRFLGMNKINRTRSHFETWIYDKYGSVSEFARVLGVAQSAAYAWCRRKNSPTLEIALLIEKLSKGKVTCKDILDGTRPQ